MPIAISVHGVDGLTLIPPAAPEFDDLAGPLLGRIASLALQLKPLLVIVSNEAAQTVVSFSKTWRVTHEDGRLTTCRDHTSFPHAVCGDVLVSRDNPTAFAPGTRRIEAKGLVIQGWGDLDEYYDQFLPQFVTEKDRMLADAADLRIELNAAIFGDGTLVGPDDDSWLADLFTAYVQEKQHWYRGIIQALDAGRSVEEAFAPIQSFFAGLERDRVAHRYTAHFDDPRAVWKLQGAGEAASWRQRFSDADIPDLLHEAIRLEPFVIRRPRSADFHATPAGARPFDAAQGGPESRWAPV
jgi:hypothetical protein